MGNSWGRDMEIYIRNQPYSGQVTMRGNEICIPLEDFAKFAKLSLHQKGSAWCLTDPGKGDAKCPLETETSGLFVNGEKFSDLLPGRDGRMLVPLKKITQAIGATYTANKDTGIIDVTFPRKGVTQQDLSAAQSAPALSTGYTLVYYYFDG